MGADRWRRFAEFQFQCPAAPLHHQSPIQPLFHAHPLPFQPRPNQHDTERDGKLPETQIGRALRELGIGRISALSPQAKGRIERFFETAQDRLVKGMRKRNVCTLEAANGYLGKEYLPLWNERLTVRPAHEADGHRPLSKQPD